jgi:hypothetical protein
MAGSRRQFDIAAVWRGGMVGNKLPTLQGAEQGTLGAHHSWSISALPA